MGFHAKGAEGSGCKGKCIGENKKEEPGMAPLFEAFGKKKSALFLEKGTHECSAFIGEDA